MAINSSPQSSNTRALLIFAVYLLTNTSLTLVLIHANVQSYSRLAVSKKRSHRPHVLIFGVLAAASLGVTWYYMLSFFTLSYRSWAFDHNVQLPISPTSWNEASKWLDDVQLGPWLKDVKLFRDAWETVVETNARKVWSLPIFFVTAAWSVWIAKEAHKRKIKYGWAYMVLGQLVAISFAMNLFYLAVLVHPVLDEDLTDQANKIIEKRKSHSSVMLWSPPSFIYSLILPFTLYGIIATATMAGRNEFLLALAVPHILLLIPPILQHIDPSRFGVEYSTIAGYDAFYNSKLQAVLHSGIICEAVALYYAFEKNTPEHKHLHRHSNVHVYPWKHLITISGETAFQNIWRSLFDHPAVSSVGWDSILCTISFAAWNFMTSR